MKLAEMHDDVFLRNIMVFAGHGGYCRVYKQRPKHIRVPEGTTITFWCSDGHAQFQGLDTLDNDIGKLVDVTNGDQREQHEDEHDVEQARGEGCDGEATERVQDT